MTSEDMKKIMITFLSRKSLCSTIDPHKLVTVAPIKKDDYEPFYVNLIRKSKRMR